ncbi:hypothetical protein ESCO_000636 [Escovopsis weberi]|uniref:Uncharacterized protein n=1 Tax=Escovopsis weberi TaxID=150374 RepID=A0A0M9VTM3_ESCWE|nr:hypothetical protein ESCO_000636 [Escovopsis weberi]
MGMGMGSSSTHTEAESSNLFSPCGRLRQPDRTSSSFWNDSRLEACTAQDRVFPTVICTRIHRPLATSAPSSKLETVS